MLYDKIWADASTQADLSLYCPPEDAFITKTRLFKYIEDFTAKN